MNKKIRNIVIAILIILVSVILYQKKGEENTKQGLSEQVNTKKENCVLYYGITCPHCKKVEKWLDENVKVKEESRIVLKEVYRDHNNSTELGDRAKECQIDSSRGVGVPFLYDNGQCLMGDQPIIDYLTEKYLK